jgi:hypothetical protein
MHHNPQDSYSECFSGPKEEPERQITLYIV